MEENNNYSREQKKQQLRKNIVDKKTLEERRGQKQPKIHRINTEWLKKNWKMAVTIGGLLTAVVLVIVITLMTGRYTRYQILWSAEAIAQETTDYQSFGTGMVQAARDQAIFYNEAGEEVWTVPYEMKNPHIVVKQNYLVIFDLQGQKFVVCNASGQEGSAETSLPITRADISEQGVIAIVMEEEISSYISYYDKTGKKLEIDIKSPLATYGYPCDISISPNGQQLMVSFYYISDGIGKAKVVFYDFEAGKEVPDRTIGAFEDYDQTGTMIPDVTYFSNQYAFAAGDNRLSFFRIGSGQKTVERIKEYSIQGTIQSIFYNSQYLGVITTDSDQRWLTIYNTKGEKKEERAVTAEYEDVFFSGDCVVFYNETICQIESFGGRVEFQDSLNTAIERLLPTDSEKKYMLVTKDQIQRILFK